MPFILNASGSADGINKANTLNKMESYNESLECVEKVLSLDLKNENALKIKEKTLKLLKSNKS